MTVRAVLSGSFHKDREGLQRAYDELVTCGCQVLSPHRLDFDGEEIIFVRDRAEQETPAEILERHHLLSIKQADFLWVHAPDGRVGVSTAFEIGYALANGIPIFSNGVLDEPNVQPFIRTAKSVYAALVSIS
jgi:nucleoside 2-deoxyribosyltransferase